MGKVGRALGNISNSVQIIPITKSKFKKQRLSSLPRALCSVLTANMQRIPPVSYMSDPHLIPRVQKYLETNVDKSYVDIGLMADELQNTYREYSRRKRSAFRNSVQRAYSLVLKSYGFSEDPNGSSSQDDLEETESETSRADNFQPNSSMNSRLMEMYASTQNRNKIDENELIDISSDDSEEDSQFPDNKASNGPSSSIKVAKPDSNNAPKFSIDRDRSDKSISMQGRKRKFEEMTITAHKKKKSLAIMRGPPITFKDIAGMDKTLREIYGLIIHVKRPEVFEKLGKTPPRGLLFHGPPGCGKTLLANAVAGELSVPLLSVSAPELVAGVSGESEERIRELFERAVRMAPCVLFIDEIDAITVNRKNSSKEMEKRIVAQVMTCLDGLQVNPIANRIVLIGATNRPDSIDPALRRADRFDREIRIGIPDEKSRIAILKLITSSLTLDSNIDWQKLAMLTPGYVAADLVSLIREAILVASERLFLTVKKQKRHEVPKLNAAIQEDKETEQNKDLDKSEPEIIVDDDPKESIEKDKMSVTREDSPVLVIEDDNSKQGEETPLQVTTPILSSSADAKSKVIEEESEMVSERIDETFDPPPETDTKLTWQDFHAISHAPSPVSTELLEKLAITFDDFETATKRVQPSSVREGFDAVPTVRWQDVGALKDIRDVLMKSIVAPIKHEKVFERFGLTAPKGVLLCGPPGCGKTLLAKAVASEAGLNFLSVKGPELLNMYVGESERAVRTCFQRARNSAPCVIFFDEFDALCPNRADSRQDGPSSRVVNQLLTEMDGIGSRKRVSILAATNKPDIIDPAVLRPGRLDKIVYVGMPSASDRVDILKTITKNGTKPPLDSDVDLEVIGNSEELNGYTGADLAALVSEAASIAIDEVLSRGESGEESRVNNQHFQQAIAEIMPSVSEKERKNYEALRKKYTKYRQHEDEEMELS